MNPADTEIGHFYVVRPSLFQQGRRDLDAESIVTVEDVAKTRNQSGHDTST
jgi:hypothetical protein